MKKIKMTSSWRRYYECARGYFVQNGNLNVGKSDVINGMPLGRWLGYQRERRAEDRLSDVQIRLLDDINMKWNVRESYWNMMYAAASAYFEKHSNTYIPRGTLVNGHDLSQWVNGYRARRANLSADKIKKLERIGVTFEKNDRYRRECWERGYGYACDYYRRNGHLYVLEKYKTQDGYNLGVWIRAQRVHYKEGRLSPEYIERLEKIGMLWRVDQRVQTSFNEQAIFYYLKMIFPDAQNRNRDFCGCELDIFLPSAGVAVEYDGFAFHGSSQLKKDLEKNEKCRGRVFLIRVRDRRCPKLCINDENSCCLYLEDGADGYKSLNSVIIRLLELLRQRCGEGVSGISVDTERDSTLIYEQMAGFIDYAWNSKLRDARQFYSEHGHLNIPYGFTVNGYNLGSWLQEQRRAYLRGRLEPYKIDALEKLGILWQYRDETWMTYYGKIKQFYLQHGNTAFSLSDTAQRVLYYWKNDQLKMMRKGRLSVRCTGLLNEIGITAQYAAEQNFSRMCGLLQKFRMENGHSIVPIKYCCEDGTPLGGWLQRQRGHFKNKTLSKERLKMLTDAGFCNHNYEIRFYQWLELLRDYRKENGDLRVPQSYCVNGKKLGKFINKMRVEYRKGQLAEYRIELLEELGMEWYIQRFAD